MTLRRFVPAMRPLGDQITANRNLTGVTVNPHTPEHLPTPEHLVALNGSTSAWCGSGTPSVFDSILDAAKELAPEAHVGISVTNRDGTHTTLAGTDPLVFMLDELQYDLGEGPGFAVMVEDHTVIVDDAESEHRWPNFISRAIAMGLRSHLGVAISIEGKPMGALNMYATEHVCVDAVRLAHARLFATQAALALGQVQRENDLVLALQSSRNIGKAIGLVMERFDLDDHEAFERLSKLSQNSNIKLRDLAEHLVKQANDLRHFTKARQAAHEQQWSDLARGTQLAVEDEEAPMATPALQPPPTSATPDEIDALLSNL